MIADGAGLHVAFLAVYLLALIGVGALKARKVKTQEDFSLAGRGLTTWILTGTLLATWIGTGSIFGTAEEAYKVGTAVWVLPLSSALGIVALFALAARIRRFGQFTIQDILEARFGVAARVLGTITLLLAYVIIVSYQYRAGSAVLEHVVPGMGHTAAVCAVAAFVILYTALAGMFSVAYTDVANGLLMVLGLALAIPLLFAKVGGPAAALETLDAEGLHDLGHYSPTLLLSLMLPPLFLILGDANMVQRFFSAKDEKSARRSAAGMFFGVLLLDWMIICVALLGRALIAQGKLDVPMRGNEEAPGQIVVHLAFNALPGFLGAMLVATVVAVVVSTADSYLLSPATSLVRDVYQRFVKPDANPAHMVKVGRFTVLALGLVALGLAFLSKEYFSVALFAYTIYGAGITPAILAAYFWKRATLAGAVSSMLTGVSTALVWKWLTVESSQTWADGAGLGFLGDLGRWATKSGVEAIIPAIVVSIVVLIVVSLLTPPPDEAHANAI
ncbi:MAG: sodium:solute symporter family protein [Planctomycetota bacterium]|nr:sodium:solute symporter family protein [Planctomycetota bacterium]